MKAVTIVLVALVCSLMSSAAKAETIVAERIKATNRLIPPTKITVGPDDQYHGSLDPKGEKIVFTHKADLVAHLRMQDLKSGDVLDLLPLTADSQEPVFAPTGKLAFTYYRFSARGDICWIDNAAQLKKTADESLIHCLKRPATENGSERSNPFWVNDQELGFVVRDISGQERAIVAQNITTGASHPLVKGRVWSPSMQPGGHFLVFNQILDEGGHLRRTITIRNLVSGKERALRFAIPGLSGFPSLSEDEGNLYFSHYLNDTTNDNTIDANDNAVIFRVPLAKIFAASPTEEVFPEQLTSVESSCSFPRSFHHLLYATCAYDGGLDVYQIPETGIVPPVWNQTILNNALDTSRSYQDRVLILNTLHYRFPDADPLLDRKLLSNYILGDDTAAARYYLESLQSTAARKGRKEDTHYFALMQIYLRARELKKAQPDGEVGREFEQQILALRKQAAAIPSEARLKNILLALFTSYISSRPSGKAPTGLKGSEVRPLERLLEFELASRSIGDISHATLSKRLAAYREMLIAPELTEESKIYYAFELLKEIELAEKDSRPRQLAIETFNHDLAPQVQTLLRSESLSLQLIAAEGKPKKAEIYRDLDKLMSQTRNDYFLRKALYVRAILNFNQAAEFYYLSLIATNWLRYTDHGDTEFIYAREVFSNSALDQAYDSLGKKNLNYASSYFYQSLSLTDDLESHEGYVKSMVANQQRTTVNERYVNLKNRQFIDENMKFVQALLLLVDHDTADAPDKESQKVLKEAVAQLESMNDNRDSAVRHLLLGYCYERLLFITADGLGFDSQIFENAHRHLMLAYDIGRENVRLQASALVDLGLLHLRAQNFGLAARFFTLRKPLGFISPAEKMMFAAAFARALYYTHQVDQAANEMAEIPPADQSAPFRSRRAFYLAMSGKFAQAVPVYSQLLQSGEVQGDLNLAELNLAYGFSLMKARQPELARQALLTAYGHARLLKPLKKDRQRWIDFEPKRILLVISGLLGQVGDTQSRIQALRDRKELLEKSKGLIDEWQPAVIENLLWLAQLQTPGELPAAVNDMKEALKQAAAFGETGQYLGAAVFHTTVDYLAHGLLHPEAYGKENHQVIEQTVAKILQAYGKQKLEQPVLDFQKLKLEILWQAYRSRVAHTAPQDPAQLKDTLTALLKSAPAASLQASLPKAYGELEALSRAL
jgi:hypothetical protein